MRLFIAINFSENVKEKIIEIINELEKYSVQGKFVAKEHLHLTLEFLGEISEEQVELIKNIMDKPNYSPFTMKLSQIGYFKRNEGNIYWIGIENNKILLNTQKEIHKLLVQKGFNIENRPYKPHITLGRKIRLKQNFDFSLFEDKIKDIIISVDKIDLMKSENIKGKLIYSIIHSKKI